MSRLATSLRTTAAAVAAIPVAMVVGPLLGARTLASAQQARERRDRTVALLQGFLDEPMASTRRAAWAFLQGEGEDVRHFSHYVLADPDYGDPHYQQGIVALLKVLLFQRTVQDLRAAGALDEAVYQALLTPHRTAWAGYTARMAERSGTDPEAIARGDAALFSWRRD